MVHAHGTEPIGPSGMSNAHDTARDHHFHQLGMKSSYPVAAPMSSASSQEEKPGSEREAISSERNTEGTLNHDGRKNFVYEHTSDFYEE